jgi:hypothetical protein
VRHYAAEGSLLGSWGGSSTEIDGFGGCCNPARLAVLPCGAVVTSERGLLRIKVHERDGKLSSVVATPAQFPAATKSLDVTTRKANGGEILVLVPSLRVVRVYVKKGAPAPPPSSDAGLCPEEDLNLQALASTRP